MNRVAFRIGSVAIAALLWIGIGVTNAPAQESRVWTSKANGAQFKGALVKVDGESVTIRRDADQAVFTVKKAQLVPADVKWIEDNALATAPGPGSAANEGPMIDLSKLIAGIPEATGAPAVGVLVVKDGKTLGFGVAGVRKAGTDVMAEPGDQWHLGSCTKSMTATLAATFVEASEISWDSTIGEILGKDLDILEAYEDVTLGTLLANRSGIPGSPPNSVFTGIDQPAAVADLKDRDLLKQRALYAEAVLNLDPVHDPGSAYAYSNAGFVVAGAMLEAVSGKPWEKLIEERIFSPLGMKSTGFGNAARNDRSNPSQPWPHLDGGKTPFDPGPGDDNSWVIGPAGTVHGSLTDIARYLAMHANRELGPVIKKAETWEFLHTAVPDNQNYARGWIVGSTGWSNGPAVSHDGSNTMNYCSIWVAPGAKAAVAAFTNTGPLEKGREICNRAIDAVVEAHLK